MPAGRRSKLTPEVQEAVCEGVRRGYTYKDSAILAGINIGTLHNWRTRGEQQRRGRYREFVDALTRANAEIKQKMIDVIRETAERGEETVEEEISYDSAGNVTSRRTKRSRSPRDARTAIQFLERRDPEEFGRRVLKHEGSIDTSGYTPPNINIHFDGESDRDKDERLKEHSDADN